MKIKLLALAMSAFAVSVFAQGGYQDGVDYFNANRVEDAKVILNNTLNDAATNKAVSFFYLGNIEMQAGNVAAAQGFFDKGVAADAANPFNYIGLGEIALKNGDKKAAEAQFKIAEGLGKKDASVSAAIARAFYNVDPTLYAKEISKYIQKGYKTSKNTEPAIYMLEGDMLADGDPGAAAGLYETAIIQGEARGDRVNPEAYVKYANTYFRINPTFAINKLKELNEKLPTSALAQRELAEKYYENNQLTMAADQYGKYMSNPNHFQRDEQRYCGLLYFGKRYDESLAIAEKVIAQDPTNFYMWRMKMYNLYDLKRYDEALAAGDKLFSLPKAELNYKDYDVYGDILVALKRAADAVVPYEKAYAMAPDKNFLLEKVSEAYTDAGLAQPEGSPEASEYYKKAAEAEAQYIASGATKTNDYYVLARRYFNYSLSLPEESAERAEAAKEGIAAVDKAIEKAPEQGALWRLKGQLLQVESGTITPEVAQAYEKMIDCYLAEPDGLTKRAATISTGYSILGNYYVLQGDKATARGYFEKYLELNPNDEAVAKYLKTL